APEATLLVFHAVVLHTANLVVVFVVIYQRLPPFTPLLPYTTLFRSPQNARPVATPTEPVQPRLLSRVRMASAACTPRTGSFRRRDRKSTRLNSSHVATSYAVLCLEKSEPGRPDGHQRWSGEPRH